MYTYIFNVDRVITGHTIDGYVDLGMDITVYKRIRLMNIVAPETKVINLENKELNTPAKKWLVNRLTTAIKDKKDIVIHTNRDKTKRYKQVMAILYIDGLNINQEMLTQGLVDPYEKTTLNY